MSATETRRGFTARPHSAQIRAVMKYKRLTNEKLAILAGVSKGTIANIRGSRQTVTPETAGKIAEALDVDTDDLFTLERINCAA